MVASGFAGLAYQIVWTQQSTSWLGHESAAVLAVVAAFFGGVAAGAMLLSDRIERSPQPARWYAGCEFVVGIWSLALTLFLEPASGVLLAIIGPEPSATRHWSVAFGGTFLLLLPATFAMGATLPAMERLLAVYAGKATIGMLYAANTFGAVLGVLAAAFWLVPSFGLLRTATACVALNFACAALIFPLRCVGEVRAQSSLDSLGRLPQRRVALLLAATGLLGIGYEVLVVRALSQVTENTVYTFALLLAVYLAGTTLGAALYARWLVHMEWQRLRDRLLQALAAACLLGIVALASSAHVSDWLLPSSGSTVIEALVAESVLAILAFLLPTMLMGALFSQLSTSARAAGMSLGRALGANTLGAAAAPMLFGILLVPPLGLKMAFSTIAVGYLLLAGNAWRTGSQWIAIAATLACLLWMPSLVNVTIPEDGRLVAHAEGVMANVSVIEDAAGVATLHINNRQQEGSSATLFADARQALLPIALHPAPRRALFLGVGTGLTASAATLDPHLVVDAVELVPEVIAASDHFLQAASSATDLSRLRLVSADARRFVRTVHERYDVIVSDNFHPARSGSASLYSVEHFALVRERLAAGGLFCQWLPLHQLDLDTLRIVVRSFLAIYPQGTALLATNSLETPVLGLVSRRDGELFDLVRVRERVRESGVSAHLEEFGIRDELALLGSFVAGRQSLGRFAAESPLNTDDHPIIAYRAPRITYAPDSLPRDRLIALLRELDIDPPEILGTKDATANEAWFARLSAYWNARDRFVEAGRDVRPSTDAREMLAQVREPLLSVLQVSPEFEPAYDPLLRIAAALGDVDRDAARALLTELRRLQPARPEAAEVLLELERAAP